jgi:hypothetical protein
MAEFAKSQVASPSGELLGFTSSCLLELAFPLRHSLGCVTFVLEPQVTGLPEVRQIPLHQGLPLSKISYPFSAVKAATMRGLNRNWEVAVKREHTFRALATLCVGSVFLATALGAQEAQPQHEGIVDDWSTHSIAFTLDGLAQHPELIQNEPRIRSQVLKHMQVPGSKVSNASEGSNEIETRAGTKIGRERRDWNLSFSKGRVNTNQYPSTFSASTTPSCTADFALFGLETAGATGGQANLVGLNELYTNPAGTGFCTGTAPNVMFAYNTTTLTGGRILTSPVISLAGTKIAFVETTTGASVFHVLTWTSGQGGITTAFEPTAMTSTALSTTEPSTTSAPYVEYGQDVAFVGDDAGYIHKFTGVFNGTPTQAGSPWPILVATGVKFSPPVYDQGRGMLLMGGNNGSLYEINVATGKVFTLDLIGKSGTNPGILAAPVVDITNGTTFVVSANNGSNAILAEVDTTTLTTLATANIGEGASTGTNIFIYQPQFNNAYWNGQAGAAIYTCGTGATDTTPYLYSYGFNGRLMNAAAPVSSYHLLTSTAASCSGLTEFYNANVNGGTDFFFFGLTQDCTGTGTSGCVLSYIPGTATPSTATIDGGTSGIVVDNNSLDSQASSIYFTAEKANIAYKYTQYQLQ